MENEPIEEIKRVIIETAVIFGHSKPVAEDFAQCTAHKIMKAIGGSAYYIPQKCLSERNEKIKTEWNGKNKTQICKKYAISKSTLWRILK